MAPNKFLAKIASGWRKPDGLTVISPERVERFLEQLPVEALWGVGPVTARKLREAGIERLVQVRTFDAAELAKLVGGMADWLRRLSYGDDPRPVMPDRPAKSVQQREHLRRGPAPTWQAIRAEVGRMARENAEWLARKRLAAKSVDIKVRYADFSTVTRSHTLSLPTSDADVIASWAMMLLEKTEAGRRPVRLLGAGVHGLVAEQAAAAPALREPESSGSISRGDSAAPLLICAPTGWASTRVVGRGREQPVLAAEPARVVLRRDDRRHAVVDAAQRAVRADGEDGAGARSSHTPAKPNSASRAGRT